MSVQPYAGEAPCSQVLPSAYNKEVAMAEKVASLADIRNFFEMESSDFVPEWKELDEEDRDYFRKAVAEAT